MRPDQVRLPSQTATKKRIRHDQVNRFKYLQINGKESSACLKRGFRLQGSVIRRDGQRDKTVLHSLSVVRSPTCQSQL